MVVMVVVNLMLVLMYVMDQIVVEYWFLNYIQDNLEYLMEFQNMLVNFLNLEQILIVHEF